MDQYIETDAHSDLFKSVTGTFYRTIDPVFKSHAIAGSRLVGRYSSSYQPTLYLSASHEGMAAAIAVHKNYRAIEQEVVEIAVEADHIFDLRDASACDAMDVKLEDAKSPWQDCVVRGQRPKSWAVRDRIIQIGGKGIIDPSRQRPGLWHLVLFEWNQGDTPNVRVLG